MRHLADDLYSGNQAIEFPEIAVAFSAGLFWPVDLIAKCAAVNAVTRGGSLAKQQSCRDATTHAGGSRACGSSPSTDPD
jgi:hypothetical protein